MDFAALLAGKAEARAKLQHLAQRPEVFGPLRGRLGLLASRSDRKERRIAALNGPALLRDIEDYQRLYRTALNSAIAEEEQDRSRLAIDIPTLSPTATRLLEEAGEAIRRDDLARAASLVEASHQARGEIEAFTQAVATRFGERTFLPLDAREPFGQTFDTAALHLTPGQKETLARAWPLLRTAQNLPPINALQRH